MTDQNENPEQEQSPLDEVLPTTEPVLRDRREHGKTPRPSDEELEHRTKHERVAAGLEDYVPDDTPSATE